jgi:hypothetical protein
MTSPSREIIQSLAVAGVAAAVSGTANASLAATVQDLPLAAILTDPAVPQPIEDGLGATDPGPRNVTLDRLNPDMLTPPMTDAGDDIYTQARISYEEEPRTFMGEMRKATEYSAANCSGEPNLLVIQ